LINDTGGTDVTGDMFDDVTVVTASDGESGMLDESRESER
jgi:hypothetical protein